MKPAPKMFSKKLQFHRRPLGALTRALRSLIRTPVRRVALLIFAALLALESPQLLSDTTEITSYVPSLLFEHNLHTVVESRLYRSARMPSDALADTLQDKGIKTVINLSRGGDKVDDSGLTQREVVESHGADYFEIPLNGKRVPSRDRLLPLLAAFETSSLPILIHCTSGTHRSGLASAIWLLEQEGASLGLAEKQLSVRYGFFRFERELKSFVEGSDTIDQVLWQYKREGGERGYRFSSWALQNLAPYDARDDLQNQCSDVPLDLLGLTTKTNNLFNYKPARIDESSYSQALCAESSSSRQHKHEA